MTYKWEAIAQDLTEERDKLLKENERLRKALEIATIWGGGVVYNKPWWVDEARAALKSEKQ